MHTRLDHSFNDELVKQNSVVYFGSVYFRGGSRILQGRVSNPCERVTRGRASKARRAVGSDPHKFLYFLYQNGELLCIFGDRPIYWHCNFQKGHPNQKGRCPDTPDIPLDLPLVFRVHVILFLPTRISEPWLLRCQRMHVVQSRFLMLSLSQVFVMHYLVGNAYVWSGFLTTLQNWRFAWKTQTWCLFEGAMSLAKLPISMILVICFQRCTDQTVVCSLNYLLTVCF